jgi:hypothetical protein
MSTTYDVSVTADDIRDGVKGSTAHCALALAMSRAINTSCQVGLFTCIFDGGHIELPDDAIAWRERFDTARWFRSLRVRPFTFQLTIP